MAARALILLAVAAGGVLVLGSFVLYRARATSSVERLDIDALGLELMSGCCAFVVFTTPSCRPCKAALQVVRAAAEASAAPTEVMTVDAVDRSDLALEYEVRTIPTVFLITASGHVVQRWKSVPDPLDVERNLALI